MDSELIEYFEDFSKEHQELFRQVNDEEVTMEELYRILVVAFGKREATLMILCQYWCSPAMLEMAYELEKKNSKEQSCK